MQSWVANALPVFAGAEIFFKFFAGEPQVPAPASVNRPR